MSSKKQMHSASLVCAILFWTVLASSFVMAAKASPMPCRDDALKHAALRAFRAKLLDAVSRKDSKYLRSVMSPTVLAGHGGAGGIAGFSQQWEIDNKNSAFWRFFKKALTHGGIYSTDLDGPSFMAPYPDFNSYETEACQGAICAKNVVVRKSATSKSPEIARLSFETVEVLDPDVNEIKNSPWTKVKTKNKVGFVQTDDIITSIDYFVTLEQRNGKWRLSYFGHESP